MANEVTPVEGPYEVHDYTVSVSTLIEQHTLMQFSNPRTSIIGSGDGVAFAGVLATEKVADNGKTETGHYTTGTFVMTAVATIGAEGAIVAGAQVVMSGSNLIRKAIAADLLTGAVVGIAMEDIAAGTTGEVKVGGR